MAGGSQRTADVGPNSTTWSCVRVGQVSDPGIPADDQPGISDQRGQPVKIRSAGQHRVSAVASGSGHSILGAQQGVVDICSLVPQTAAPQLACEASGWVVTRSPQTMAYPRGTVPKPRSASSRNARRKCHRSRRSPAERIAARPCRTAGGAPWHHSWSSLNEHVNDVIFGMFGPQLPSSG
jgi:hypothetical protein